MKHIFTIHSPITFFCALNVAFHERLCSNDVIFICSGYYPDSRFGKIVSSVSDYNNSILRKIRNFNIAKASDRYISSLVNNSSFTAYIDLAHYYQKLIISHPMCSAFHFIEEGTASYLAPKDLNELTRIEKGDFRINSYSEKIKGVLRILRGYSLKSLSIPYFAKSFSSLEGIRFYGFSEDVYPGVTKEKIIVLNPIVNKYHGLIEIKEELVSNSLILIEESYFKVFNIEKEFVEKCYELSLIWLKKHAENRKIYVKLRPKQRKEESLWIRAAENNGIRYTILEDDYLEVLLVFASKCKVVGTVSSLLYYAVVLGHEAYSNYSFIERRPTTSFDYADYYWNKVQLIESV